MSKLFIIIYWTNVRVERRDKGVDEWLKKGPIKFIDVKFNV